MKTVESNINADAAMVGFKEENEAFDVDCWEVDDEDGVRCHDDVVTTTKATKTKPPLPRPTQPPTTLTLKKYSKEYFEKQIQDMKTQLLAQLPTIDSKKMDTFASSCQSYQDVKTNLTQAKALLDSLEKKKKKDGNNNNDDDDKDWDNLIQQGQTLVDTTQTSLDDTLIVCKNTARTVLDDLFQNKLLDTIDEALLLQCTILIQSTPTELAKWCDLQPERNGPLFDKFLNSTPCMKLTMKNGGPLYGQHYNTVDLYHQIEHSTPPQSTQQSLRSMAKRSQSKRSTKKKIITTNKNYYKKKKRHAFDVNEADVDDDDMRQKLTMAIALQLTKPILHMHSKDTYVDPIQRYWHYVNAYENTNDLDDAFANLSIFDLRCVVDSDARDSELQWGRDYLKAYRPDQVLMTDTQWRYCRSVRTDVNYRHPDHKFDSYQELLSAGGECGPRAFFGRFICKSFGIPTWGCRQPGHAAMSHYTPDKGWVICLGAAWKWSWWDDQRYGGNGRRRDGPDFYEETQARRACAIASDSQNQDLYYQTVSILECIAEILGETVEQDVIPSKIWRSLALMSRKIHADTVQQVEQKVDEEDVSSNDYYMENADDFEILDDEDDCTNFNNDSFNHLSISEDTTKVSKQSSSAISVTSCGSIVIPATSFTSPSKPTSNVLSMPSYLGGGTQLHLEHDGCVEYVLPDCISEGSYMLTCRLVNVHIINQVPLLLSIEKTNNHDKNDGEEATVDLYSINVEYTSGAWRTTTPIKIEIGPKCTLKFSREQPCHGLSIKDFTCQPC